MFRHTLKVTNKAIGWTSIAGFALMKLPGILDKIWSTSRGGRFYSRPIFMQNFLSLERKVNMLSLWFLVMHVLLSVVLLNPTNYGFLFANFSLGMTMGGEASVLLGILATALALIVGICLMPSVRELMTKPQSLFVFDFLAWLVLVCTILHVVAMGSNTWFEQWPGGLPPVSLLSIVLPFIVAILKVWQTSYSFIISRWFSHSDVYSISSEMTIQFGDKKGGKTQVERDIL